tara:strand:- start:787 stop:888 length:102 start_codon:yes stop_codon:yes gene_type:complete
MMADLSKILPTQTLVLKPYSIKRDEKMEKEEPP